MIAVEVHIPLSGAERHSLHVRRLQQQVEDAHGAAIEVDTDEADQVVLFTTNLYLKAVELA